MKSYFVLVTFIILTVSSKGQNIGIGTLSPNSSAILDISDSTRGLLIPRLTLAKKNSIVSPTDGLLIYQTDNDTGFYFYQGTRWSKLNSEKKQLSKIIYAIGYGGGPGYVNSKAAEYWVMNTDGTNSHRIPVIFSAGFSYSMNPKLSLDGQTVFFSASDNYKAYLYSCSIDGSNLTTLLVQDMVNGAGANIEIGGLN
jgi:Tol biopolymer transport system component